MMSVLLIVLKNWKIIVGFAAGFALAFWIQGIRVEKFKIQNSKFKIEIQECQNANASNIEAIGNLKADVTKANSICSKRLNSKDALIKELQRIDSINNQGGNNAANSNSPLIIEFNKLFIPSN